MVQINLSELSVAELQALADSIQTELKSRNVVDYLIDDSNRYKSRDTIESYWKVMPKSIVRQKDGYHVTDQVAVDWVNERADRLGWELIKVLTK